MGSLHIFGRSTGHSTVTWDLDSAAAVREAERLFDEATADGTRLAFRTDGAAGEGRRIREFDPAAADIYIIAPMVGGAPEAAVTDQRLRVKLGICFTCGEPVIVSYDKATPTSLIVLLPMIADARIGHDGCEPGGNRDAEGKDGPVQEYLSSLAGRSGWEDGAHDPTAEERHFEQLCAALEATGFVRRK